MLVPTQPKIYHIVHADRLASIVSDGYLWSDAIGRRRGIAGTTIGMNHIKERRLRELVLNSHSNLPVGNCVPFYFCPRSVMLFSNYVRNSELTYQGGQDPIVHLEADLRQTVTWADANRQRWAFTSSSAASYHFTDYADLDRLDMIDWAAVGASDWRSCRDDKQAEFLVEDSFPWALVSRIGIRSQRIYAKVQTALQKAHHRPTVAIKPGWYY